MNLLEIRQKTRAKLDDEVGTDSTRYWKNAFLNEAINATIEEVAIRSLCIIDSLTDTVCLIPLVAGQMHYALDEAVLHIQTVQPSWRTTPLGKQSVATISGGWLANVGLPDSYLLDYSGGKLSLTSAPAAVTTESIRLTLSRLPLAELSADASSPEIPRQYHRKLFNGIIAAAFLKHDSEVYNPAKAKAHRAEFENDLAEIVKLEARLKPRITIARRCELS